MDVNFKPVLLKYEYSDYEPYISKEIMQLHYEKHYLGYLNKFLDSVKSIDQIGELTIESVLCNWDKFPKSIQMSIRNNGGGYINHNILWEILNPKNPKYISQDFENLIIQYFQSFENFKNWFFEESVKCFGSGWTWLVIDKNKNLKVYALPNQDSPFMNGDIPIMGIDIWEHAYYLQFKNLRNEYLENIWKIIDWKVVEERYKKLLTLELKQIN